MAQYFNARQILPTHLLVEVLKHIPKDSRNGAVLYFNEDYYAARNHEIAQCFQIYQADPSFGGTRDIYQALAEQFCLTVRQIENIVCGLKEPGWERPSRSRRRQYSGITVRRRIQRRMVVRTAPPV
jgi:hypothetical protein